MRLARPYHSPIVAAVMLAPALYVLSEAPLVRWTGRYPDGGLWKFYALVDWLIDETPLDGPLLAWSRFWGVEEKFSAMRRVRQIMQADSVDVGENSVTNWTFC